MSKQKKQTILLIEPSEIIAAGLKHIIDKSHEYEIINTIPHPGYYNSTQIKPDIIVLNPNTINYDERLDIRPYFCPGGDNITIVALTSTLLEERVMQQFDGSINIHDSATRIIQKLQSAVEDALQNPKGERGELSSRERDILIAVAKGNTNKEIADEYNISVYTVISHRRNISRKLGINSISGLTVYAIMNKLVDISELN